MVATFRTNFKSCKKTTSAIRQSLESILQTEARSASESIGFTCVIRGEPKLVRGAPRVEFWFRCGQTLTVIEGKSRWTKTVGILQFTLYAPGWCDEEDVLDLGDLLARMFGQRTLRISSAEYVMIERMEAIVLPSMGRRKMPIGVADAGFDYCREHGSNKQ